MDSKSIEGEGSVAVVGNSDKPAEIPSDEQFLTPTSEAGVGDKDPLSNEGDGVVVGVENEPSSSSGTNIINSDSKSSEGDGSVAASANSEKPAECANGKHEASPLNGADVRDVESKSSEGDVSAAVVEKSYKPAEGPVDKQKATSSNGSDAGKTNLQSTKGDGSVAVAEKSHKTPEKPYVNHKPSLSNGADVGSMSAKSMYFRADQINLGNWDVMEARLSRVWSRDKDLNAKKEEWEIDLAKLNLKNTIAHGTYGTVYKANYDGQDVAVKVLDWGEDGMATIAETASLRASFRKEVAVWHKLDHPNVTKFIGASMGTSNLKIPVNNGDRDTYPSRACCVVVEYLAGGTLKNYLIRNRRRKLAIKVVIQIALDLSRGLSYLHSKKIVHRDVKTENMLLDTSRILKIADFGVARVEAQNPRDMTGETGTLGYMAPEVLDGKPYNHKCDVYSFGICLWEIYCCDMPYPDLSFADVSSAVVRQNLRPEIPRCCPSSLASIMRKCWDANPDKRPEMDEVVRLLEAVDTSKGGGMIPDDQVVQSCFCFGPTRGP